MMLLALALAFQCPDGSPPPCRGAHALAAPAMSVAVLTFENRSRDSADTFLGDGLADEIASELGGVEKLTVRSRAMVRRLAGAGTMAPPVLGRALGAAYLVDGSIQRAGPQLRVQVALLRASTGDQAWAQTYDRSSADLFQIQSDIAQSVSEAIAGRLLPQERASLTRAPTHNSEAYQLYLQAVPVRYVSRLDADAPALAALERAIAIDSNFADAWALLSFLRMRERWESLDRSPANYATAVGAANRALRLAPDNASAHVAMAYVHYWGSRDYGKALAELTAALRIRPNDADSWNAIANLARRQNDWEGSLVDRRRAIVLDPGDSHARIELAMTQWSMRRYDEALASVDSAARHGADSMVAEQIRAEVLYAAQGRAAARPHWLRVLAMEGRTIAYLELPDHSNVLRGDPDYSRWVDQLDKPTVPALLLFWWGLHFDRWRGVGDSLRARAYGDSVRTLFQVVAPDTSDMDTRIWQSGVDGLTGHMDDALRLSEVSLREMPISRDAYTACDAMVNRAFILARAGRSDEAVALVEQVLGMACGQQLSAAMLRDDPDWNVLRGNPRFDRLIAGL